MSDLSYTELTSYGNIDLIGQGVFSFLDGQLSIDTQSLDTKSAKLACFCNHKGRIVSLFHIMLIDQGVRLVLPKNTIESAEKHIKKYAVFFKVEIAVNSTELYGVCYDQTAAVDESNDIKIDQTDLWLRFDGLKLSESDDSFWFSHLIERKISWLTLDTIEHFLPHDLNLPSLKAIDFKKGCFTGQEVIARMQYKGKLKKHIQSMQSNDIQDLPDKTRLTQNGKSVGEIVCSIIDKRANSAENIKVLAVIKDSANLSQQFQTSLENSPILEISS